VSTKGLSQEQLHGEDHHAAAIQEFLRSRWQVLAIGALVVGIAVVATGIISSSRKASEAEAHAIWYRAQQAVILGEYGPALEAAKILDDQHSGTPSGRKAILIKADALLGQGNAAEAKPAYEEAARRFSGDPVLLTSAKRGLAVVLENQGSLEEAAKLYEDLAGTAEPAGGRLFDLRSAARCYHAQGNDERATGILEKLVAQYETSEDRVARDQVHLAKVALAEWRYTKK